MSNGMKILNIVILSAAVIVAGIFIFKKFFVEDKNLTEYLPLETQSYFEFNPHDKNLLKLFVNNKRAEARFGQLLAQADFWADINQELIVPEIKKIG